MKIFFAMDLMDGKAVRLLRGDFAKMTVYSEEPLAMVEEMRRKGAKDFHIIDLDGARTGRSAHRDLIKGIRERVAGYMEVGGGIRAEEDIAAYRSMGIDGVIVGTSALLDRAFFARLAAYGNIVLGLDMLEGRPMVKGWKESVDAEASDILARAADVKIMAILYTSIARDGTLAGPDLEGIRKMKSMTSIPIIASGGVSAADDLGRLKEMNVWAAIVGKAFYEGRISVEEATAYAD